MEEKDILIDVNDEKDLLREDAMLWKKVSEINTKEGYREYLSKFPAGMRHEDARRYLSYFSDEEAWETAKRYDTKRSYEEYLSNYPSGRHVIESKDALVHFDVYASKEKGIKKWTDALEKNSISGYENYIIQNPSSPFKEEARKRLHNLSSARNNKVLVVIASLTVAIMFIILIFRLSTPVAESGVVFDGDGGTEVLSVSAEGGWRIVNSTDWIKSSACDSRSLSLTVSPNPSFMERRASIVVKSGLRKWRYNIIQSEKIVQLEVDRYVVYFTSNGGYSPVSVKCNDEWHVEGAPEWLRVVTVKDGLALQTEKNTSDKRLECQISIVAHGKEEVISVCQNSNGPGAQFLENWFTHNEYENDDPWHFWGRGMTFHARISTEQMTGKEAECLCWLYSKDGTPVKNKNEYYGTTAGNVCFWEDFRLKHDGQNVVSVFIPYSELHIEGDGEYYLSVAVLCGDKHVGFPNVGAFFQITSNNGKISSSSL